MHSCLSGDSEYSGRQVQAPDIHVLYMMIQSELSEQRSPRRAVITLTVAGVGL